MIAFVPRGGESPHADRITLGCWCTIAFVACLLLWRRPAARRGVWLVVAGCCVVIALDKAFDLQTIGYELLRVVARGGEALLELPAHDRRVKAGVLLVSTAAAVAAIAWLVHRDRPLDGGQRAALLGILLVLSLVGMRFLPGLPWLADERVGWVIEGLAATCLCLGFHQAFRGDGRGRVEARPPVR